MVMSIENSEGGANVIAVLEMLCYPAHNPLTPPWVGSTIVTIVTCSFEVSIAVVNAMNKKKWAGKDLFGSRVLITIHHEGVSGQERKAGSCRQELKHGAGRMLLTDLLLLAGSATFLM